MAESGRHLILVLGAGPAGLYCAKKLSESGCEVVILNRDVKPGGLAEYGIFPTKHAMKEGLRKQFRKILAHPQLHYFGNVRVGAKGHVRLEELDALAPSAIVVAAGAQGTKSLGIPGEDAAGVFHAKDLVYHYNRLPPFSQRPFPLGKRVGIIGLGNVMCDVANWACNHAKAQAVFAIGRRGPAERKYTPNEFHHIAMHLDREALRQEIERIRPTLTSVGQDAEKLFEEIVREAPETTPVSATRFSFLFLRTPREVLKDGSGRIRALRVENNRLEIKDGALRESGTGTFEEIAIDTLVFAIGDQVDAELGLPYERGRFVSNPAANPAHPDFPAYQAFDPKTGKILPGRFLIGWARKASEGLVGKTRQDGEKGAEAVLDYLKNLAPSPADAAEKRLQALMALLSRPGNRPIPYSEIQKLEKIEQEQAQKLGLEEFKFSSNEEMLAAIK